MKNLIVLTFLVIGIVFGAAATGNNLVEQRANNLTDKMIRELRLNNYQSNKVREINLDKATKMLAAEKEFAGNQEMLDQKYKAISAERDRELERVLSTVQYNSYFGSRNVLTKFDQQFMAELNKSEDKAPVAVTSGSESDATVSTIN
ncbi:hypothetical protein FVR03_09330 [Pontibacter qinzhouensis]|uniref:Uncharacterized protein n=1 Tax=Pontibacter qinzhouensis TaxID=2603253 RepID=A0A5C8K823_9BACT|nr:hypothetical protein [Pontibacter qinzhouensis]TXK47583.1 hypothetical protein FVR03_09330 [Pontibacter qinzhouensis]